MNAVSGGAILYRGTNLIKRIKTRSPSGIIHQSFIKKASISSIFSSSLFNFGDFLLGIIS